MPHFATFCLDREKDIVIDLDREGGRLRYTLRTPNHSTGNLITNLAAITGHPLTKDESGLKVMTGTIPCHIDGENRRIYMFRLGQTKVANIYDDGRIERRASIPAIAKTLMSQTTDYNLSYYQTLVKTFIPAECKFRTDLHTHMNGNLPPDILIALGIFHRIRYPLYYVKKLGLDLTEAMRGELSERRAEAEKRFRGGDLKGKYLTRRIDDNTFIDFSELILGNLENAAENISKIRNSLAVMKDGQAVFADLEKVYIYRYVFARGVPMDGVSDAFTERFAPEEAALFAKVPDSDVASALAQMALDSENESFKGFKLYENALLWIARNYAGCGVSYAEISDTNLAKRAAAPALLERIHAAMPAITKETGVTLRFLAALRRIPLLIGPDQNEKKSHLAENLAVLKGVAGDPYVAGSDIVGEEANDIRELSGEIAEITKIAADHPSFVLRIHAGENDALTENVANAVLAVKESLAPGQAFPRMRIGHGLYTPNLKSKKGAALIKLLKDNGVALEFQLTSNVRLNNLSHLDRHPLPEYLSCGISCVQGTDGGALYGTNSIDEELSLERMVGLSQSELMKMKAAEDRIYDASMLSFSEKMTAFKAAFNASGAASVADFYGEKIGSEDAELLSGASAAPQLPASEALAAYVRPLPQGKLPVIVLGGSFNSDRHKTRMKASGKAFIDALLGAADPEKVFFVIGHRASAYEKYLAQEAKGRFEVFSFVPSLVTPREAQKLAALEIGVRISKEPVGMGLYKSFYYEIFKRRPSGVIALDANASGMNVIQDARNSRFKSSIFLYEGSADLKGKAKTLSGYVRTFKGGEDAAAVAAALNG